MEILKGLDKVKADAERITLKRIRDYKEENALKEEAEAAKVAKAEAVKEPVVEPEVAEPEEVVEEVEEPKVELKAKKGRK